jgi:glycerophosphoryl diester phosphodiesterase
MTRSPLVYAHRGSSAALPEHTLAAYLRALDDGADGLECDVRLTRDGHLVCVHDRRLERTSNGRGRVSSRTLAELDALDFGSWHQGTADYDPAKEPPGEPTGEPVDEAGPVDEADPIGEPVDEADPATDDPRDPDRVRLLTLDRLLCAVRDADRDVRLLIETKHPTRYGSWVERRLVGLLSRHGLAVPRPGEPVQVTVMSFSPLALRKVHELAPELPTVLLLEVMPPGMRPGRLPFGVRIAGPSVRLARARPALIPALRAAGNQVYVWTVNKPADIDLVSRLGVDGIITDRPREVLARLGR